MTAGFRELISNSHPITQPSRASKPDSCVLLTHDENRPRLKKALILGKFSGSFPAVFLIIFFSETRCFNSINPFVFLVHYNVMQ